MPDPHADLQALAGRLHDAAARLKAAGPVEVEGEVEVEEPSSLQRALADLDMAAVTVRQARERLAAAEAQLRSG